MLFVEVAMASGCSGCDDIDDVVARSDALIPRGGGFVGDLQTVATKGCGPAFVAAGCVGGADAGLTFGLTDVFLRLTTMGLQDRSELS